MSEDQPKCDHEYAVQRDGTPIRCTKPKGHIAKRDRVHEAQIGKVRYTWK